MNYYFIIGILLGLGLIIYAIINILKVKTMQKTKAIVSGNHFYNRRLDTRVTRIEFEVNGVKREYDLNYYSVFLRKGKQINIYYNPNKYDEVYYIQADIFTLILGMIFLVGSIFLIFI